MTEKIQTFIFYCGIALVCEGLFVINTFYYERIARKFTGRTAKKKLKENLLATTQQKNVSCFSFVLFYSYSTYIKSTSRHSIFFMIL